MYQIAICDSEKAELDRVECILGNVRSPLAESAFLLKCFTNTEDLLRKVEIGTCQPDIILLDISMSEQLGIETVRRLRSMGNDGKVVFLASSAEYALAAFEVEAVSYLLKPVSEEELFKVLEKILEDIKDARHEYVLLRASSHIRKFALRDIIYCEAQGKKQYIYLSGGECVSLRTTMAQLREVFCDHKEFVSIGASYIVNLRYVESWNRQKMMLDNGRQIYLPRGAYRSLPGL